MDSIRLEAVPPGTGHLDTVRALHQTVVSLRTALEVSKNELKELKEKYEQHSHCLEYADVVEKLKLENHILRCKIIDSDYDDKDNKAQSIKLEVTYSPRVKNIDCSNSEVVIQSSQEEKKFDSVNFDLQSNIDNRNVCSTDKLNELHDLCESVESPALNLTEISPGGEHNTDVDLSQISSLPKQENEEIHQPCYRTKLELLSKFDVRIKVRTLKEGSGVSSGTSDSGSLEEGETNKSRKSKANFEFCEKKEHFEKAQDPKGNRIEFKSVSTDNIKMAVPNEDVKSKSDKFDVQVRITSEESLVMKETVDRTRRKDTLNLDVDDLSLRSLSEGDNSVFSEGVTTPVEPRAAGGPDEKVEHEASGNESEEVDDIELIFTTDESKDMSNLQEDLVSIRESEWQPQSATSQSTHSTPVLIKFHTLDPDFQPGTENKKSENENAEDNNNLQNALLAESLKVKRVSLPNDKEIRHVAFNAKGSLDLPGRGILKSCDNKSDNMLYKKSANTSTRRLDSIDSLTCEFNRGLSLDNTKSSSFELGSSMDILHRDESVDSFQRTNRLGHRFSVFAETDISKCGISEDDLSTNLNIRRNTCPNPFQYRAPTNRGASRPTGPFKATAAPTSRLRPVIRDPVYPRRESGAQTDVSALPPRWSSDGYLAHNMAGMACNVAPTLPSRGMGAGSAMGAGTGMGVAAGCRRLTVADARAPPLAKRSDEARRVMLSDIGFTSMVPELSRSADPVWALGKIIPNAEDTASNSTSKFLSRGSSYRSPCPSIDRSNDWTPQTVYVHVPSNRAENRCWRSSLPDVRHDDTDDLLREAENYLRRSIDNLRSTSLELDKPSVGSGVIGVSGQPYIPAEPKNLRLGHVVKVITPHGRIAVGRVRYVGIAGGTAATSSFVVGVEFLHTQYPGLCKNDGTYKGRRYFLTPPQYTALFVPFSKVVMAWAN